MAETYRIAVIGDWDSVMGFQALGLETYPFTSVESAKETAALMRSKGISSYWTEYLLEA